MGNIMQPSGHLINEGKIPGKERRFRFSMV
jgi:hypothetical protein